MSFCPDSCLSNPLAGKYFLNSTHIILLLANPISSFQPCCAIFLCHLGNKLFFTWFSSLASVSLPHLHLHRQVSLVACNIILDDKDGDNQDGDVKDGDDYPLLSTITYLMIIVMMMIMVIRSWL